MHNEFLMANDVTAMTTCFKKSKMAASVVKSSESLRLLNEYTSLKRLIESHKRRNGDSVVGKSRPRGPRPNSGFNPPNIYSLKRTTTPKQNIQSSLKTTNHSAPKGVLKQPSKLVPFTKSSKFDTKMVVSKYKMTKYNNLTSQLAPKLNLHTTVVKNTTKSQYSWSASCSKREVPLSFPALNVSVSSSSMLPSVSPSKFSRSTKPKPIHKIATRIGSNLSLKTIHRVSKYSLKYTTQSKSSSSWVRSKRQKPIVINKKYALNRHQLPSSSRNAVKSRFVVIGKLLYRSSKTKLSCTGSAKTKSTIRSPEMKKTDAKSSKERIVTVRGIKFSMDSQGKTLRRVDPFADSKDRSNCIVASSNTAVENGFSVSRVDIGGETYIQTKPGVLIRSYGNQLRSLASRVVTKSIYRLTLAKQSKSQQFCLFFNKFGRCSKQQKGNCPYVHDVDKIAVCKRFLRGECRVVGCTFSHKICSSKMPVCTFFVHGRCSNETCPYRHVNVNPKADFCVDFANGYCPLGEKCKKWHVTVCTEYERNGQCERGDKCPLTHRKKPQKNDRLAANLRTTVRPFLDGLCDEEQEGSPLKRSRLPSFISLSPFESPLPNNKKREENASSDEQLKIKPGFMTKTNW